MQNHTSHTARLLRRALTFFAIAFGLLAPAAAQVAATDSFDPAFSAAPICMAQQPNGKVLFGGSFTSLNGGTVLRTSLARVNADGTADTSFDAGITAGIIQSIVVQPDGKILVAGFVTIGGVSRSITRLESNGSLDSSFTATGVGSGAVTRILLQPDGKILAWSTSGVVVVYSSDTSSQIARLNADGSRDTSFNVTGFGFFPIANVTLQPDGKVVYGHNLSSAILKVIGRLNANGTTDTDFGNNVPSTLLGERNGGIAIQRDGRIVFTSNHDLTASGGRNGINRLMPDGTLDTTFAGATLNGTLGSPAGNLNALSPQADGKLVVFGNLASGTFNGMTRLNADGSLDGAFAPSFLTTVPAAAQLNVGLIQADGKVIGSGGQVATVNGTSRFRVARLTNEAATQTLAADSASTVTWTRSGSAPDAYAVYFENSTDGGTSWTRLSGTATRVSGTGNWQLTGLSLPASGQLRATGLYGISRVGGNGGGGSSSVVQQTASYSLVTATAPVVTTATQSGVTATSATLGGEVTADGGAAVTDRGIVWNTTGTPTTADTKVANGTGTGVFSATVGSLPPNTTIHVRAYATNSVDTSYGTAISFATPSLVLPTVVTTIANSGAGSLRQAVLNANANPGADTITFDPTVFATAQTIVLATSNFAPFTGDTTVTGPAAGVTVQAVSVAGGVFTVGAGTTAGFSKLTINGGANGILNHGTLTASNCGFFQNGVGINNVNTATVTGCSFVATGIYNGVFPVNAAATLTMSDCSFTLEAAPYISNNGTMTMSGCTTDDTPSGSSDYQIFNLTGATLTLTNCSVLSAGLVGNIANLGTLVIQNCTVVENRSTANTGTLTLKNTIFRKDPASGTDNPFIDGGGNLILNSTGNLAADLTTLGLDPTGLQNNGGPTRTFKLLGGAAINGGVPANVPVGVTTDQRGSGFARNVGTVDIGAYEHPSPVQLVATTASAAEGTGAGTTAFTFTVSRPGATTDAVTVNWAVTGTGTNPADAADFGGTLPSGTLTLPIGVASDIITIAVSKDAVVETDETFTLTLSAPTANHAIAGNGAVATITNDDSIAPPTNSAPTNITLSPSSIAENNAPGATVGTLTATDADAGQTHTFTFASSLAPTLARAAAPPSNDNAAFTITGNVLSINAAANFEAKSSYNIRVRATDSGAGNLSFEKNLTVTITDVTIPQTITFGSLANKSFGDAAFTVSATGGASGQPVTFGISGPATIAGNLVTITGVGEVTVTASQAGAGDYSAAAPVQQSFTVAKAAQAITFAPAGTAQQTDTVTLTATGGASGEEVTFSLVSGPGSLAGNVLTFTADGTVIVRASQAGNANYNAAANVDRTIVVGTAGPVTTGNFFSGLLTDGTGKVRGSFLARLGPTGFGTVIVWVDGRRGGSKTLGASTLSILVGGVPMAVDFTVGPVSPSGNPTRLVTVNTGTETLTGTATRSPYELRRATLNAGKYTFAATSQAGAPTSEPKVGAVMTGTITRSGAVRITARLGNGRVTTFSSQEQSNGEIAFYCGYGIGGAQSLAGTLARTSATAPEYSASLRWTVPAGVDARIPTGVDADYDTIGARYTAGAVGNVLTLDASKRVTLGIQSSALFSGAVQNYTFPMTANVVAFLPVRPFGQIRFFPAAGMFSGTTSYDYVRRNFYGVLLQGIDLNYGVGYLEDVGVMGTVSIQPESRQ